MTKIIQRPEITTHVLDFPFHYIKNEKEAKNVRKIIGDKEVLHVHRGIDENTFQPILYFAIPEKDKPFFFWMKYAAPMELWSVEQKNSCTNKNPDDMCKECDCWKHTRAMCG